MKIVIDFPKLCDKKVDIATAVSAVEFITVCF